MPDTAADGRRDLPDWMGRPKPERAPGQKVRHPIERRETIGWIVAAVLGIAWGIAFRRTWPLAEISSPLAIIVVAVAVLGLGGFVLLRKLTGTFDLRASGGSVGLAVAGALLANGLTPGLAQAIDGSGHLSGRLGEAAIDQDATCHWGPGREQVIGVRAALAGEASGLPAGELRIDLAGGAITLVIGDAPMASGTTVAALTIAMGADAVGQPADLGTRPTDNGRGAIRLDAAHSSIDGELHWTCQPAPAAP